MRLELVEQAVSFLGDANVQQSPLAKQISFLEGKGLNEEEIQEALERIRKVGNTPSLPIRSQKRSMERNVYGISWMVFWWLMGGVSLVFLVRRYMKSVWGWIEGFFGDSVCLREELEKVEMAIGELRSEHEAVRAEMMDQARALGMLVERADKDLEQWKTEECRVRDDMKAIAASLRSLNDALPQVCLELMFRCNGVQRRSLVRVCRSGAQSLAVLGA